MMAMSSIFSAFYMRGIICFSYSGPGSQLVTSEWKFDFNTFLSSGLGYIVLEVDGAGSSGRGQVRKETGRCGNINIFRRKN